MTLMDVIEYFCENSKQLNFHLNIHVDCRPVIFNALQYLSYQHNIHILEKNFCTPNTSNGKKTHLKAKIWRHFFQRIQVIESYETRLQNNKRFASATLSPFLLNVE